MWPLMLSLVQWIVQALSPRSRGGIAVRSDGRKVILPLPPDSLSPTEPTQESLAIPPPDANFFHNLSQSILSLVLRRGNGRSRS